MVHINDEFKEWVVTISHSDSTYITWKKILVNNTRR